MIISRILFYGLARRGDSSCCAERVSPASAITYSPYFMGPPEAAPLSCRRPASTPSRRRCPTLAEAGETEQNACDGAVAAPLPTGQVLIAARRPCPTCTC